MGNLNLDTIAGAQEDQGQTSNDADDQLDQALTEKLAIDLSGGDYSILLGQFTRAIAFVCSGNTVARTLNVPGSKRLFVVRNNGTSIITVQCGTATASLAPSDGGVYYTDGTTNGLLVIVGSTSVVSSVAANSILGNNTGSIAAPIALTISQAKTLLAIAAADLTNGVTGTGAVVLAASPTLTSPVVGTQSPGDASTKAASTGYADAAVAAAIAGVSGGLVFKGTWNATTNTPTITGGSGTLGWFYKVATAGTTSIDGVAVWNINDILLYDGAAWLKVDGIQSEVTSVAGRTGAVVIADSDVTFATETANKVFASAASGGAATPAWRALVIADLPAGIPSKPRVQSVTFASSVTLDCSLYDVFEITLTGAITIALSNGTDGQSVRLVAKQDATGSRVITWDSAITFGSDITSAQGTASTAANKTDYFGFHYNGGLTKYNMVAAARGY